MENKKIKICFLGNASSVHTIKWARFFSLNGYDTHLVSFDNPETNNLGNIKFHKIKKVINTAAYPWMVLNILFSVFQTKKVLKEIKPDIVNAHYATSYGLRAVCAGFHPLVLTAWGSDILITPRKNFLLMALTKFILKKCDIITCDARHMKKAMVGMGVLESKIKIINFGVDTGIFIPGPFNPEIRNELGDKNDNIIISLKWPDPISDYETLIKAAALVIPKNPNAKFIALGPTSFPKYFEGLEKMLEDYNIKKNFKFLGNVAYEKIPEYLKSSDIYVCTSASDAGLASSTAEAMACGLPPLITKFGDNDDWVKNGENGFIFPIGDYKILAEKILYLLNHPEERKIIGNASRKIILERNSYDGEMRKMGEIYNSMVKKYQICARCLMDTSDPAITFDENGVCNHCHLYDKQKQYLFSEEKLKDVAKKIKQSAKGKKYDCVIGLSGGVDSCMSAYLAKKAGLNPLAVHIDNGWNSELSQGNIERTLKKLNIDLYTHVIDWEEFKDIQKSFLKSSVANIDYPYDHAILALLFNKAAELGLKYVIYGTNIKTEFIMPREWGYNSWDLRHLTAIQKRFGAKKIKTLPTISLFKIIYYSLVKRIRIFRILDYIEYNKKEAKGFLKKEFEWQDYGGKHCESIYTRFFVGYFLPRKFGFDRNRAWMSTLILSGQLTREEALKELEAGFYSSEDEAEKDKDYVIKKLGLSKEEFADIMKSPVKSYRDYPNFSIFLNRSGIFISLARRILRKI